MKCRKVIRLAWCTTTQQGWLLVSWQIQAVSRQVEASKRGLLTAILKGVSPKSRLKLSQVRKTRVSEVIQHDSKPVRVRDSSVAAFLPPTYIQRA